MSGPGTRRIAPAGVKGMNLAGRVTPNAGSNRRLEFELGAGFEGACGFALVLALSQMREHGLGPFGRADLHPRRNPLDRQGRFAPQPGSSDFYHGSSLPGGTDSGLAESHALLYFTEHRVRPSCRAASRTVPARNGVNEVVMFPGRVDPSVRPAILSARLQKRGQLEGDECSDCYGIGTAR